MSTITLLSINTATAQPLQIQGHKVLSAIGKQPRQGRLRVGPLGLEGDEQADPQWHGGVSKAVYAYPAEHYGWWEQRRRAQQVDLFDQPLPQGFFGENLTVQGLLEQDVFVGDVLHFPDCSLRVTEPRQPCFKVNAVMGDKLAAKKMLKNGLSGFYLAVVKTGTLSAGQSFKLVQGARETSIASLNQSHAKKADKAEE